VLLVDQIHRRYGSRRVLDGVSASCAPGETLVVVGENGSGKSTLLSIVAGLIEPNAGQVILLGKPITAGAVAGRRHLGYLPDAPDAFPDLAVAELLALSLSLKRAAPPAPGLESWTARLGLSANLQQRLDTLSFGQRKRAFLLSALIGDPWLLILDEPSNGLDPGGVALVLDIVAERRSAGQATLVASNDASFVMALGGTVLRLAAGRLTPEAASGTAR
jgi:ABC-type multidrug transport system ATPase subunit